MCFSQTMLTVLFFRLALAAKKKEKKKKRLKGDNNKALWSTKSARYPTKD